MSLEIIPRWFRATDSPKLDNTPFKLENKQFKPPQAWLPFSIDISIQLNLAVHNACKSVPCLEDLLYEANAVDREVSPSMIYYINQFIGTAPFTK
jgi:hypothetical protein